MRFILCDNQQKQIATITRALSAHLLEEIGQYDALTVDFPRTPEYTSLFKQAFFVGIPIEETEQYKLFKIDRPDFTDEAITITAVEAASDDLAVQGYIYDEEFDPGTIQQGLEVIFSGSSWNYDMQCNNAANNFNFYKVSRKTALKTLCDTFSLEVQFTYTISGNRITNKTCHVYNKLGHDTNKRLIKGRNVTDFKMSKDMSQLFTAAVGKGASVKEKDEDTEKSDAGANTTTETSKDKKEPPVTKLIDFSTVEWSKAKGDPVDKPYGKVYVELPEATAKYGWYDNDGKLHPRLTVCEFSEDDMPENLLIDTYNYLIQHSAPAISVTATVAKIGKTYLGDRVLAIDFEDDLRVQARATKINRDLLDDNQTVVTIGNYKVLTPFQRQRKALNRLAEKREEDKKLKDKVDDLKDQADKFDKDLDDLDGKVDDLDDKVGDLDTKTDNLDNQMDNLDNQMNGKADQSDVDQKADKSDVAKKADKKDLDDLAKKVTGNTNDLADLKKKEDALAKQVETNTKNIADLKKKPADSMDLSKISGVIKIITDKANPLWIDRIDIKPDGKEEHPLIDGSGNIAPNLDIPNPVITMDPLFNGFGSYSFANLTHDLLHNDMTQNRLANRVVSAHDVASIANDIIRNLADHGLPCTETEAQINGPDADPTNDIAILAKQNRLITGGNWYDIIGTVVKQWIQKQIDDLDIKGAENTLHGQIQQNADKLYDLGQKIDEKYDDLYTQIGELKMQLGK